MRLGPIIHGAALVLLLLWAYQTWTRDQSPDAVASTVVVWGDVASGIQEVAFEAENKKVKIVRKREASETYLWGIMTRTVTPPSTGQSNPSVNGANGGTETLAPNVTTREFAVGEEGDKLLKRLGPLHAVRDLGVLSDVQKKEFGLDQVKDKLWVQFHSGARELTVGARVYGGDDRYVIDSTSGRGYVLAGEVLNPIEMAESSLRERKLHSFEPTDVARVMIKTPSHEKAFTRKGGGEEGTPVTWVHSDAQDKPDQTVANFMERLARLMPMEYTPEVQKSALTPVFKIEYYSPKNTRLGFLDLYKGAAPPSNATDTSVPTPAETTEYYLHSERTRVLAKVHRVFAERADQDLSQLFGK